MATLNSSIQLQDNFSAVLNSVINSVNIGLNAMTELNQTMNAGVDTSSIEDANNKFSELGQNVFKMADGIRNNSREQEDFNQKINEGDAQASKLMNTIKGFVAAYVTVQGAKQALDLSDELTSNTARLNLMNDGLQTTEDLQNMIYLSAQRSRGSYLDTAAAVSKLGLMAKDAFSSSKEIIAFTEQVNKQFVIAGTSSDGARNAMLQLTQAMASGVLRGDELNSIFEQAPTIIQSIADYLNVPIGKIRKIAKDGEISASVVKAAMFAAANDTNAKFESMPMTFAQIWTNFQSTAIKAFEPVLARLNEMANSTGFRIFVNNAIENLVLLAGVALNVLNFMGAVATGIADNWSWLSPIIYGVVTVLTLYNAVLIIYNGIKAISAAMEALHAAKVAMSTGATFAATAAQYGFNAALLACPITWIVLAIIAVIAIIYAVITIINKVTGSSISATGVIIGAIAALGTFLWNLVTGVINAIIQFLWTFFVEPWIGIIEFVLNVFNGGFNSFGDMVANLIGQIISWFLSLGKVVTKIIDAIFGTDWTSGLSSLQDSVLAWGKNENAITLDRKVVGISRVAYSDAYDAGYKFGENIEDTIANFDLKKIIGTDIPDPKDYPDLSNFGDTNGKLGNIDGNTKAIKNSMDITEEDLKYLRDIAEQETVNRFTTASITVKQTNHNKINSNMDLDGMVSALTENVMDSMEKIAEGVHE